VVPKGQEWLLGWYLDIVILADVFLNRSEGDHEKRRELEESAIQEPRLYRPAKSQSAVHQSTKNARREKEKKTKET